MEDEINTEILLKVTKAFKVSSITDINQSNLIKSNKSPLTNFIYSLVNLVEKN